MTAEQLKQRYAKFWEAYRSTAEAAGLPRDHHRADWDGEQLYIEGRANIDRFALVVRKNRWWVEYMIDTPEREATIARFRHTFENRGAIQSGFGDELDWTMSENRKRGTIRSAAFTSGVLSNESDWPGLQAKMQLAMARFLEAVTPFREAP